MRAAVNASGKLAQSSGLASNILSGGVLAKFSKFGGPIAVGMSSRPGSTQTDFSYKTDPKYFDTSYDEALADAWQKELDAGSGPLGPLGRSAGADSGKPTKSTADSTGALIASEEDAYNEALFQAHEEEIAACAGQFNPPRHMYERGSGAEIDISDEDSSHKALADAWQEEIDSCAGKFNPPRHISSLEEKACDLAALGDS